MQQNPIIRYFLRNFQTAQSRQIQRCSRQDCFCGQKTFKVHQQENGSVKLWYIHTMEFILQSHSNEPNTIIQFIHIKSENVMPIEKSKLQKTHCLIPFNTIYCLWIHRGSKYKICKRYTDKPNTHYLRKGGVGMRALSILQF